MFDPQEAEDRYREGSPFTDLTTIGEADHLPVLPTGLPTIDRTLGGGFRPGVLNLIAGSYMSGKTNLALSILANNFYGKNILCVQLDEPARLFVPKLYAMLNLTLPPENLLIVDDGEPDLEQLAEWYDMATARLGHIDIVLFDYMERFHVNGCGFDSPQAGRRKAQVLKSLVHATEHTYWLVIHQANAAGRYADVMDMRHLNYGGGPEVDGAAVGCRQRDPAKMGASELEQAKKAPRSWVSVMKNKWGPISNPPTGVECVMDPLEGYKMREATKADTRMTTQHVNYRHWEDNDVE